jgi:hypothetical protein
LVGVAAENATAGDTVLPTVAYIIQQTNSALADHTNAAGALISVGMPTEATTAGEASSSTVSWAVQIAETASAQDTYRVPDIAAIQTDGATASDTVASAVNTAGAVTAETANAQAFTDFVGSLVAQATEGTTASHFNSASTVSLADTTATASAQDAILAGTSYALVSVAEPVTAGDTTRLLETLFDGVVETAQASDFSDFSGIFQEPEHLTIREPTKTLQVSLSGAKTITIDDKAA